MTTNIEIATSDVSQQQSAVVRYYGIPGPLSAGATIGVTVGATAFLHTVPAGGQALDESLGELAELISADPSYGAAYSPNSDEDACLKVSGEFGSAVTVSLPVYTS